MKLKLFAIVLASASSLAGAAHADTVRVRGTVVDLAGTALTVKARDGKTDTVTLSPDWMISGIAKASAPISSRAISSASHRFPRPMAAAARWRS